MFIETSIKTIFLYSLSKKYWDLLKVLQASVVIGKFEKFHYVILFEYSNEVKKMNVFI